MLLVPGWGEGAESLQTLRGALLSEGWADSAVVAVEFADPVGSNVDHAEELRVQIEALREATGAAKVDVVAHSMGGLATRAYLRARGDQGLAPDVARVVFLATPHEGTIMAYLAWGRGASEMHPRSPFLEDLNRRSLVPEGTLALALWTPVDSHIVPGASATPAGIPNERICCPTHRGLLKHDVVQEIVVRFLRDGVGGSS